jgi:hypothetical protein
MKQTCGWPIPGRNAPHKARPAPGGSRGLSASRWQFAIGKHSFLDSTLTPAIWGRSLARDEDLQGIAWRAVKSKSAIVQ